MGDTQENSASQENGAKPSPRTARGKRGCWALWFRTSKGRRAIHMEMKMQMFGK